MFGSSTSMVVSRSRNPASSSASRSAVSPRHPDGEEPGPAAQPGYRDPDRGDHPPRAVAAGPDHQLPPDSVPAGSRRGVPDQRAAQLVQGKQPLRHPRHPAAVQRQRRRRAAQQVERLLRRVQRRRRPPTRRTRATGSAAGSAAPSRRGCGSGTGHGGPPCSAMDLHPGTPTQRAGQPRHRDRPRRAGWVPRVFADGPAGPVTPRAGHELPPGCPAAVRAWCRIRRRSRAVGEVNTGHQPREPTSACPHPKTLTLTQASPTAPPPTARCPATSRAGERTSPTRSSH